MRKSHRRMSAKIAATLIATSMLGGCFLSPGQFESRMDIRADGQFSFTYEGEIFMLALSDLAEMADAAEMEKPCMDQDTLQERPCRADELEARRAEQERENAMMQSMLGGMDMSDPEAAEEFAAELERQAGWDRVEYVGNGTFSVDFAIRSTLGHDFAFPTFENFPMGNAFVTVTMRDDDRVRIQAPGYAAQAGNPFQAMMGGMAGAFGQLSAAEGQESEPTPNIPQMQGSFSIVTNAQILANNTDEGPSEAAGGQVLAWQIAPGNMVAPTALLSLAR